MQDTLGASSESNSVIDVADEHGSQNVEEQAEEASEAKDVKVTDT